MPDDDLTGPAALFSAKPHALSKRERETVISRIESLMAFWGITVDDLERADDETAAGAAPARPHPVKYIHPATGETWDGQGAHPDWLRRALLKEGYRVEELRPTAALDVGLPEAGG